MMLLLKTILFVALMATTMANHSCPDYWTAYGNKCYRMFDAMNWYQAQEHCDHYDSKLVSVNDREENDFVAYLSSGSHDYRVEYCWLGLGNYWYEDPKRWEDGSTVSFTAWDSGEPNNAAGNENCIMMHGSTYGKWTDDPCEYQRRFMCEGASPRNHQRVSRGSSRKASRHRSTNSNCEL